MPLVRFLKQVFSEFSRDRVSTWCAAISYTALFAAVPVTLVVISVVGFFFGEKAAQGRIFASISEVVGPNAAHSIQNAIIHAHHSSHGTLALIVGFIGTILAAAALTNQMQNALDVIFAVVPDPKAGWRLTIYNKIKGALILIIGSLLVAASVFATALVAAVGIGLENHLGIPTSTLDFINIVGSLAVFVLLLYMIYRFIPDVTLPRKTIFVTAAIVGVFFLIGKIILGVVIGHNATTTAYGAAASLITLLLWFYYSSQILFFGAEGMKVYLNNRGYVYTPRRYALRQKTVNIQVKNNLPGRMAERFAHGFTKSSRSSKK
jgi:membrane protein